MECGIRAGCGLVAKGAAYGGKPSGRDAGLFFRLPTYKSSRIEPALRFQRIAIRARPVVYASA